MAVLFFFNNHKNIKAVFLFFNGDLLSSFKCRLFIDVWLHFSDVLAPLIGVFWRHLTTSKHNYNDVSVACSFDMTVVYYTSTARYTASAVRYGRSSFRSTPLVVFTRLYYTINLEAVRRDHLSSNDVLKRRNVFRQMFKCRQSSHRLRR